MFRRTTSIAAVLLAAASCCAAAARAQKTASPKLAPDVILFNNGDTLTGKLIRGTGSSLVFKSDVAGEVTIALDKVKELRANSGFAVLRKDAKLSRAPSADTGNVQISAGQVTVITPATPVVIPAKEVAYIIDEGTFQREIARRPGLLTGLNGSVSAGATLVRSTTNATTYTTGIALVRAIPAVPYLPARNRTSFNLLETYGQLTTPSNPVAGLAYSQVKTSIFHTDAERDEYVSPRFYALAQVSFDHNYAQGLSLQQVYGDGAGWTPYKNARQQLDLKADIHYERQAFLSFNPALAPTPALSLIGSTISNAYRVNLPRKLVFTQSANILPAFNNSNAYSANVTGTLILPVYNRLSAQISTTDNYLNDPAAGFKKNSYQFTTGITYSLH